MENILHVDLTKQEYYIDPLSPELAHLFFGGRGLGIALLFKHFSDLQRKYRNPFSEIDPFSEENPLIFSTSPTTGSTSS